MGGPDAEALVLVPGVLDGEHVAWAGMKLRAEYCDAGWIAAVLCHIRLHERRCGTQVRPHGGDLCLLAVPEESGDRDGREDSDDDDDDEKLDEREPLVLAISG